MTTDHTPRPPRPPDSPPLRQHARGPCRPADVRRAVQHVVACRCGTTGAPCDETALSDALLVASELTTNAIRHGGGVTEFDVDLDASTVRVSMSDRSDRLPVVLDPHDDRAGRRTGGRGRPIVCRLSREVRVADLPSGGRRITAVVPLF